jgi:hypothetical protein
LVIIGKTYRLDGFYESVSCMPDSTPGFFAHLWDDYTAIQALNRLSAY